MLAGLSVVALLVISLIGVPAAVKESNHEQTQIQQHQQQSTEVFKN